MLTWLSGLSISSSEPVHPCLPFPISPNKLLPQHQTCFFLSRKQECAEPRAKRGCSGNRKGLADAGVDDGCALEGGDRVRSVLAGLSMGRPEGTCERSQALNTNAVHAIAIEQFIQGPTFLLQLLCVTLCTVPGSATRRALRIRGSSCPLLRSQRVSIARHWLWPGSNAWSLFHV